MWNRAALQGPLWHWSPTAGTGSLSAPAPGQAPGPRHGGSRTPPPLHGRAAPPLRGSPRPRGSPRSSQGRAAGAAAPARRTGKRLPVGGGQWRGPAAAASQWQRAWRRPHGNVPGGEPMGRGRAAGGALSAARAGGGGRGRPSLPLSSAPRRPRRAAWPGWAAAPPPSGAARTPWCGRCPSRCAGRRCAAPRAPRLTSPARSGSISCTWACCGASWGCRCWSCRPTRASPTAPSWRTRPWSARRRRSSPARARPAAGRRYGGGRAGAAMPAARRWAPGGRAVGRGPGPAPAGAGRRRGSLTGQPPSSVGPARRAPGGGSCPASSRRGGSGWQRPVPRSPAAPGLCGRAVFCSWKQVDGVKTMTHPFWGVRAAARCELGRLGPAGRIAAPLCRSVPVLQHCAVQTPFS